MLLTPEYKYLLELEHARTSWGTTSYNRKDYILKIIKKYNKTTILDYGSGQGSFKKLIDSDKDLYPYTVINYEPGIPNLSNPPNPCEFVLCTDVLEHVEPDCVENVLDDLKRVVLDVGLFTISCEPAHRILQDGRNAHLTVQPPTWWLEKLKIRFNIDLEIYNPRALTVIVRSKNNGNV